MAASGTSGARVTAIGTETRTVEPRGDHRATIVWLHDKNENSSHSVQFVESLQLTNIKWICLDSGYMLSDDGNMQDDVHELDSAASRVASVLLNEPEHVIKGVGGVGKGAILALHLATCCALGLHPISLRVVIGIDGWLYTYETIRRRMNSTPGAKTRAASQSILFALGTDQVDVPGLLVEKSLSSLDRAGFEDVTFVSGEYEDDHVPLSMIGRDMTWNVLNEIKAWFKESLPLDPN